MVKGKDEESEGRELKMEDWPYGERTNKWQVFSWGVPQAAKILPVPPTDRRPRFLTTASPQLSFVPENFKNFTSFFSQF